MVNETTLAIITKVGIVATLLFVVIPAMIWVGINYLKYLSLVAG